MITFAPVNYHVTRKNTVYPSLQLGLWHIGRISDVCMQDIAMSLPHHVQQARILCIMGKNSSNHRDDFNVSPLCKKRQWEKF